MVDTVTANTSKASGYASRDWAVLVQTAGPNLYSVAIELAMLDPGTTKIDTLHPMTARVRRLVKMHSVRLRLT